MVTGTTVFSFAVDFSIVSPQRAGNDWKVTVLGATGSVGKATLEVAQAQGYEIVALTASTDFEQMAKLCERHRPKLAAMADADAATQLKRKLDATDLEIEVLAEADGLDTAASDAGDCVVAAISGVAGIAPTMAAVKAGKRVLLANKEALITAGKHMLQAAEQNRAQLIPVDSEHSAMLELLDAVKQRRQSITKVWLTATGGPFHNRDIDLDAVTPVMAAAHPVWSMGRKISVDSATLMNKGLEVIEACLLFDLQPDAVQVVVHPQSLVHAIVEFADGCSFAQCGIADMRVAIARAFAWPRPSQCNFGTIDWQTVGALEFLPPNTKRFPCLRLAREALVTGGVAPAVLNAANEIAVSAFCASRGVSFTDIPQIIEHTLTSVDGPAKTLDDLIIADQQARATALIQVNRLEK